MESVLDHVLVIGNTNFARELAVHDILSNNVASINAKCTYALTPGSAKKLESVALGKGVGNCCSERQRDLTTFAVDAGASPEWASVLAAVHLLVDRASATEPGVRAGLPSR